MPVIVVANPKGGVGKSTLSTNLAGYFARQGHPTMLGDADRQQSAVEWLKVRPTHLPVIQGWEAVGDGVVRPPKGITHVVIDTPAGLKGDKLRRLLKLADRVVVPVQASLFDILATRQFVASLLEGDAPLGTRQLAVVGMRVDARTRSAEQLQRFVESLQVPVLGYLRDTQNYVQLAAHGLTLWDVQPSRVQKDVDQWQSLIDWAGR